jgi:hypothetical protein
MARQVLPISTNPFTAFIIKLKSRNTLLFYAGLFSLLAAFVCALLTQTTTTEVLGINAWIKPMKFYVSIGILAFTMSWYMVYLTRYQKAVRIYSWVFVITMAIEMIIITWQAANGRLSHFNISTPFYGMLFSLMGIAVTVFTLWTLYIGILFFRQTNFPIDMPQGYLWGIRLGILFFVLFAFEGGHMAAMLSHTVGGPDGDAGIPVLNWSKYYGDLRVAHFFGMHALQVLPLAGFFFTRKRWEIILFAVTYFFCVLLLYWQALSGYPLIT